MQQVTIWGQVSALRRCWDATWPQCMLDSLQEREASKRTYYFHLRDIYFVQGLWIHLRARCRYFPFQRIHQSSTSYIDYSLQENGTSASYIRWAWTTVLKHSEIDWMLRGSEFVHLSAERSVWGLPQSLLPLHICYLSCIPAPSQCYDQSHEPKSE